MRHENYQQKGSYKKHQLRKAGRWDIENPKPFSKFLTSENTKFQFQPIPNPNYKTTAAVLSGLLLTGTVVGLVAAVRETRPNNQNNDNIDHPVIPGSTSHDVALNSTNIASPSTGITNYNGIVESQSFKMPPISINSIISPIISAVSAPKSMSITAEEEYKFQQSMLQAKIQKPIQDKDNDCAIQAPYLFPQDATERSCLLFDPGFITSYVTTAISGKQRLNINFPYGKNDTISFINNNIKIRNPTPILVSGQVGVLISLVKGNKVLIKYIKYNSDFGRTTITTLPKINTINPQFKAVALPLTNDFVIVTANHLRNNQIILQEFGPDLIKKSSLDINLPYSQDCQISVFSNPDRLAISWHDSSGSLQIQEIVRCEDGEFQTSGEPHAITASPNPSPSPTPSPSELATTSSRPSSPEPSSSKSPNPEPSNSSPSVTVDISPAVLVSNSSNPSPETSPPPESPSESITITPTSSTLPTPSFEPSSNTTSPQTPTTEFTDPYQVGFGLASVPLILAIGSILRHRYNKNHRLNFDKRGEEHIGTDDLAKITIHHQRAQELVEILLFGTEEQKNAIDLGVKIKMTIVINRVWEEVQKDFKRLKEDDKIFDDIDQKIATAKITELFANGGDFAASKIFKSDSEAMELFAAVKTAIIAKQAQPHILIKAIAGLCSIAYLGGCAFSILNGAHKLGSKAKMNGIAIGMITTAELLIIANLYANYKFAYNSSEILLAKKIALLAQKLSCKQSKSKMTAEELLKAVKLATSEEDDSKSLTTRYYLQSLFKAVLCATPYLVGIASIAAGPIAATTSTVQPFTAGNEMAETFNISYGHETAFINYSQPYLMTTGLAFAAGGWPTLSILYGEDFYKLTMKLLSGVAILAPEIVAKGRKLGTKAVNRFKGRSDSDQTVGNTASANSKYSKLEEEADNHAPDTKSSISPLVIKHFLKAILATAGMLKTIKTYQAVDQRIHDISNQHHYSEHLVNAFITASMITSIPLVIDSMIATANRIQNSFETGVGEFDFDSTIMWMAIALNAIANATLLFGKNDGLIYGLTSCISGAIVSLAICTKYLPQGLSEDTRQYIESFATREVGGMIDLMKEDLEKLSSNRRANLEAVLTRTEFSKPKVSIRPDFLAGDQSETSEAKIATIFEKKAFAGQIAVREAIIDYNEATKVRLEEAAETLESKIAALKKQTPEPKAKITKNEALKVELYEVITELDGKITFLEITFRQQIAKATKNQPTKAEQAAEMERKIVIERDAVGQEAVTGDRQDKPSFKNSERESRNPRESEATYLEGLKQQKELNPAKNQQRVTKLQQDDGITSSPKLAPENPEATNLDARYKCIIS